MEIGENKHFVLVHGFGLGAWCWYKLAAALKSGGSRVTAVDLAGCGIHPDQLHHVSSFSDYAKPLMDFLASLPDDEKVVLVGHSYGGLPISLAMEHFPAKISVAVFLTAYMPNCTEPPATLIQEFFKRSTDSLMDCKVTRDDDETPVSAVFGPEHMAAKLYKDCSAEDLELGKMLVRPNRFFLADMRERGMVSEERYGAVKRCYVVCEDDEVVDEEFQRWMIERSPPHEVVSIARAGHMPMLSQTHQLASCLLKLSLKY